MLHIAVGTWRMELSIRISCLCLPVNSFGLINDVFTTTVEQPESLKTSTLWSLSTPSKVGRFVPSRTQAFPNSGAIHPH